MYGFFFFKDEVLELGDEYRKEVNTIQCGPLQLCSTWLLTKESADDLNAFYRALCTGNTQYYKLNHIL